MRKSTCLLVATMLTVGSVSASLAHAATAPAAGSAEALARQLIQLTGGGNLGRQMIDQLVGSMKQANPTIPEAFWTEFLAGVDPHQLEEIAVPIYVKNLSSEEMAAAIAFYSSPPGQSLIRKLPQILQESIAAGQQWGMEIAQRAAQKIQKYKEAHPNT